MTKADVQRDAVRRRLVSGARVHIAGAGTAITPQLIDDVREQLGVSAHMFRALFPTVEEFLDRINDVLVEECASRVRAGVDQFRRSGEGDGLAEAAVALADSQPLTRSAMLLRASRRVRALENSEHGGHIVGAERRYVIALLDSFIELMTRLDRAFSWPPVLAVRVILDTYERSFEMWLLGGHDEAEFSRSSYVRSTLPTLLREMSTARSV